MDWALEKARALIAPGEGHAVLQLTGGWRKNDEEGDSSSSEEPDVASNYPYTVLVTFSGEYLVAETKELKTERP